MGAKIVFLYTDCVMWALVGVAAGYLRHVLRHAELRARWRQVFSCSTATVCAAVLALFFAVALVDSVHYRAELPGGPGGAPVYDTQTQSLLDTLVLGRIAARERSYSAPFALRAFDKTTVMGSNGAVREFERLQGVGPALEESRAYLVLMRQSEVAVVCGLVALLGVWGVLAGVCARVRNISWRQAWGRVTSSGNPWRPAIAVWMLAVLAGIWLAFVWPLWHVLGTDSTGNDVLFVCLKSIRTAFVIGTLATLSMLPFAVVLGIAAGYFKGWVDDVIQYVYTTISSIPSVLLIAASVLMVQVFIDTNPQLYETGLQRADVRLFMLACIIGLTGWASLARLLRAETMKVASLDYVTAARAFGVSDGAIMLRHILPNVVHIVLIVAVLDFSGIVLYEAVLSYIGVGVDPSMNSFGSMINAAAPEMSRSPVIWWNLVSCFGFMLALVLSANLFASHVRDAFDPHSSRRQRVQGGDHA